MADKDLTFTAVTDEMVKYVKAKYGDTWLQEDEMSDEMFEDLCRFAKEAEVMKEIRVVSEYVKKRDYSKLKVSDDMIEYAMATYGNMWDIGDDIAYVILEDLWEKYENKEFEKDTNLKGNEVDVIIISDTSDDECGIMSSKTTTLKGSTSQASKVSAPNVVLGLVAVVGCSSTNRNEWYVPPPKELKSLPMNIKYPIKKFTCYF